jgi:hypothetical protein
MLVNDAQPHNHAFRQFVNKAHELDLVRFLGSRCLIDADCVDEKYAFLPFVTQILQRFEAVLRDE